MRSKVLADSRLFRALSRSLLQEGISVRFRAHGRSMFPAISDGEIVEVSPPNCHGSGDVVLTDSADGMRAHRIISHATGELLTRGDSCIDPDSAIPADAVIGHVSKVVSEKGQRAPHTARTRLRQFLGRLHLL